MTTEANPTMRRLDDWLLANAGAALKAQLPQDTKARILEMLAAGPLGARSLAKAIGLKQKGSVRLHLRALEATGQVKTVRVGNTIMRALASWTPTSRFATSNETRKPEGSVHDGVELLDPEADNAADGECSVEHASRSVRTTDGHGRQLRQSKTPVPADVAPSWWCAVPANGFTNVAVAHAERMRSSKEHFQVRLRLLQ